MLAGVIIGAVEKHAHFGSLGDSTVMMSNIDPHLFLYMFLPPLLFESAYNIHWHVFKKVFPAAVLLATSGVVISTGIIAIAVKVVFYQSWSWVECLLVGVIYSATDPVAVVAVLKELGAKESLSTLIEAESLLNDGTAVVIFVMLFESAQTGVWDKSVGEVVLKFLWMGIGGPIWGIICGALSSVLLSVVFNDAMMEATVTLSVAYLCFFVAEYWLGVSGVLALVALGLWYSYIGRTFITPEVEEYLDEFWEIMAYLANTLVFVITGLILSLKAFDTQYVTFGDVFILFGLYFIAHVARAVVMWVHYPAISRMGYGCTFPEAAVAWWGGLRGAVGLALALVVALDSQVLAQHETFAHLVLFQVAGMVALTLVVNAPTVPAMLQFFAMDKISIVKEENFQLVCRKVNKHGQMTKDTFKLHAMYKCAVYADSTTPAKRELGLKGPQGKLGGKGAAAKQSDMQSVNVNKYKLSVEEVRVMSAAAAIDHRIKNASKSPASSGNVAKSQIRSLQKQITALKNDEKKKRKKKSRRTPRMPFDVPMLGRSKKNQKNMEGETRFHEARRRYLVSVGASYQQQFHRGMIGRLALKRLLATCHDSIDRHADMQDWKEVQEYCELSHTPGWLGWCESQSAFWCCRKSIRHARHRRVFAAVDVAQGFLRAREDALELLSHVLGADRESEKCFEGLRDLYLDDVLEAQKMLQDMYEMYPEACARVHTHRAARQVLNQQREDAHRLTEEGLFDTFESQRLVDAIEQQMKNLKKEEMEIPTLDKRQIIMNVPWMRGLPHKQMEKVEKHALERSYKKGDEIITAGGTGMQLYIVKRGGVEILVNGRPIASLGFGACIGEMAWITRQPRANTVRARTNNTVLFEIKSEVLHSVANDSPRLHANLWRYCGRRLAEDLLSREPAFASAKRTELNSYVSKWKLLEPAQGGNDGDRSKAPPGMTPLQSFSQPLVLLHGSCDFFHGAVNETQAAQLHLTCAQTITAPALIYDTATTFGSKGGEDPIGAFSCRFTSASQLLQPPADFGGVTMHTSSSITSAEELRQAQVEFKEDMSDWTKQQVADMRREVAVSGDHVRKSQVMPRVPEGGNDGPAPPVKTKKKRKKNKSTVGTQRRVTRFQMVGSGALLSLSGVCAAEKLGVEMENELKSVSRGQKMRQKEHDSQNWGSITSPSAASGARTSNSLPTHSSASIGDGRGLGREEEEEGTLRRATGEKDNGRVAMVRFDPEENGADLAPPLASPQELGRGGGMGMGMALGGGMSDGLPSPAALPPMGGGLGMGGGMRGGGAALPAMPPLGGGSGLQPPSLPPMSPMGAGMGGGAMPAMPPLNDLPWEAEGNRRSEKLNEMFQQEQAQQQEMQDLSQQADGLESRIQARANEALRMAALASDTPSHSQGGSPLDIMATPSDIQGIFPESSSSQPR
jgi:NhaP-type Na+/H+ or K+/H+ antiporter